MVSYKKSFGNMTKALLYCALMEKKCKISLVICTYNRDKYLPEALESVKLQVINNIEFELIIIDNNSKDNTASICKKFISNNPLLNIQYFFEEKKGLSYARNRGIKESNAPIISFVDDDAILSPDYLKEITNFFEANPSAVGVGGKVIPKYASGKEPEWMNKYLNGFVGKVDHGTVVKLYDNAMKYPAGCNMTYSKDILLNAGGFNTDLTFRSDDKYIFYKVKELSTQIYYLPEAWLYHYIDEERLSLQNFKKLYLKTGNEEKIRIKTEGGFIALVKKFVEYIFKLIASFALYFLYLFKKSGVKGRYIVLSQWCTIKGFLSKNIFVR